jgi:hypothetical protein
MPVLLLLAAASRTPVALTPTGLASFIFCFIVGLDIGFYLKRFATAGEVQYSRDAPQTQVGSFAQNERGLVLLELPASRALTFEIVGW